MEQLDLRYDTELNILWISNIYDVYGNESNYSSLDLLMNYLFKDRERCSTKSVIFIVLTYILRK